MLCVYLSEDLPHTNSLFYLQTGLHGYELCLISAMLIFILSCLLSSCTHVFLIIFFSSDCFLKPG